MRPWVRWFVSHWSVEIAMMLVGAYLVYDGATALLQGAGVRSADVFFGLLVVGMSLWRFLGKLHPEPPKQL
jgi:hypothetical protein